MNVSNKAQSRTRAKAGADAKPRGCHSSEVSSDIYTPLQPHSIGVRNWLRGIHNCQASFGLKRLVRNIEK
jgi:hypothetical protein